jgi:hypothetical protein
VDFTALRELQNSFRGQPQLFTVSGDSAVLLRGRKGMLVNLIPQDLEAEDGSPVSGPVKVSLLEMMDGADFVFNNAPTVSDGRLLSSGGACELTCTAGGKKLRLKKGKTIELGFPKSSDESMRLFYGQRDKAGKMNWKQAEGETEEYVSWVDTGIIYEQIITEIPRRGSRADLSNFSHSENRFIPDSSDGKVYVSRPDRSKPIGKTYTLRRAPLSAKVMEEARRAAYTTLRAGNLGSINCDRFYGLPQERLLVTGPEEINNSPIETICILPGINAQLSQNMLFTKGNNQNSISLPVNTTARLISYGFINRKLYAYARNINTAVNKEVKLEMTPVTREQLQNMIARK